MANSKDRISKRLKERIEKFARVQCLTADDCRLIIIDAYQCAGASGKKNSYTALSRYRNWLVHAKLDKGFVPNFFKEIYQQFRIPEAEQSTVAFIAEFLSSKSLRSDLREVLKSIQCDFAVLDSLSMWKQFLISICDELLSKPLEYDPEELLDKPYIAGEYLLPSHIWLDNANSNLEFVIKVTRLVVNDDGAIKGEDPSVSVRGEFLLDELRSNFLKD